MSGTGAGWGELATRSRRADRQDNRQRPRFFTPSHARPRLRTYVAGTPAAAPAHPAPAAALGPPMTPQSGRPSRTSLSAPLTPTSHTPAQTPAHPSRPPLPDGAHTTNRSHQAPVQPLARSTHLCISKRSPPLIDPGRRLRV